MKAFRNRFQKGIAATLLLTSLGTAAVAQGFVGGFSRGPSGDDRHLLQINGSSVSPPPQLSVKLIGVTVLVGCPDESLRQVIRHKGEELGADYTAFPQVAAAAWCLVSESPGPFATRSTVGPMWSFSQPTLDYDGTGAAFGTWETLGAVTVGLHYRVGQ